MQTSPTVLFKVGGAKYQEGHEKAGQLMAFKDLPWASAKAADVYSWAKKTETEFKTWLSTEAKFATDAEVEALTTTISANVSGLDRRLTLVEESIGLREGDGGDAAGSVAEMLGEFSSTLEIITGEGEGSIKKAEADAKAYADEQDVKISENLTSALSRISTLEANDASHYLTESSLGSRLTTIEGQVNAFFDGAAKDSEGLNDALDKLVDIQKYLNGEGEGAKDLLTKVAENAEAINSLEENLTSVQGTTSTNTAAIASLTSSVDTVAGDITALQNIVNDASNGNDKLREDLDSLQELTGDTAKGNEALYTSLTVLINSVNHETTGLAATYDIANKNKTDLAILTGRVAAIEGRETRYVSDNDQIIIKCGSASENTFDENN